MDELPVDEAPVEPPTPARRRVRTVITLVVVAALVVVLGLDGSGFIIRSNPAPDATIVPTAPPPPARLAVIDAGGGLSAMDGQGGSVVRLPAPGLSFLFPAWSPDGTRVAAIGTTGDGATSLDVFAVPEGDAGPSTPAVLYESPDHPAFYLYWAPDGKALAFLTTEGQSIALRRVPADVSGPETTVRSGAPMYWQWVDPTRLLVHSGGNSADAFVGEIGIDGAPVAPATIKAGSFRAPALSGDGTYLAYVGEGQTGAGSVVVESRNGAVHHEVPVFSVAAVEFGPVGDTLAFTAADKAGSTPEVPVGPLRAIDPATGAVRTLLGGSVVAFFWAPDGRTIAAIRVNGPADTNVASGGTGGAVLARAGGPAGQSAAAVQLRIAFVDVASGAIRSERAGRLADLFLSQVLPYFDQYALSHRFWSPDSRSIVLPIDDDQGVSQIEVIPADGSDAHVVANGVIASWSP
jgi:TolB protein